MLLAREAPLGVVIRRGPSKHVCTIGWERSRDEFQLGQWLSGRIYERRSDLSPDGKHLIYFAMNGKWSAEARGSWTAVSRAPYLKAVALFPKGDCWHGGGLFTGNRSYWLNAGHGCSELHNTDKVERDLDFQPSGSVGGECLSVYYPRLLRDGWTHVERVSLAKWKDYDVFEKLLDHGWVLRKIAHAEIGAPPGKGCYWDEHELVHPGSGQLVRQARPTIFSGRIRGSSACCNESASDVRPRAAMRLRDCDRACPPRGPRATRRLTSACSRQAHDNGLKLMRGPLVGHPKIGEL